eukprot:6042099-Prymnesium_polylepis.1
MNHCARSEHTTPSLDAILDAFRSGLSAKLVPPGASSPTVGELAPITSRRGRVAPSLYPRVHSLRA